MLPIEGARIMKKLYPDQFTEDGKCKFKFSVGFAKQMRVVENGAAQIQDL